MIQDASDTIVGGPLPCANTIAHNLLSGVNVLSVNGLPAVRNDVLGNNIFGNTLLGIDLGNDGVTPNDAAPDPDLGASGLQNFPILSFVASGAQGTTIDGLLTSLAATSFRIEAFSNPACDGSGNGEGTSWTGFDTAINRRRRHGRPLLASRPDGRAVGHPDHGHRHGTRWHLGVLGAASPPPRVSTPPSPARSWRRIRTC